MTLNQSERTSLWFKGDRKITPAWFSNDANGAIRCVSFCYHSFSLRTIRNNEIDNNGCLLMMCIESLAGTKCDNSSPVQCKRLPYPIKDTQDVAITVQYTVEIHINVFIRTLRLEFNLSSPINKNPVPLPRLKLERLLFNRLHVLRSPQNFQEHLTF